MQDDNRETKTEIENNFECEEAYGTEEEYAEQTKRIKAQRPLSDYDKEEIFMVRWLTWIIAISIIILFSFPRGKPENATVIILWCLLFWAIPILLYFRKKIRKEIREKVRWYWNMLRGRVT